MPHSGTMRFEEPGDACVDAEGNNGELRGVPSEKAATCGDPNGEPAADMTGDASIGSPSDLNR